MFKISSLAIILFLLIPAFPARAAAPNPLPYTITVTATIGEPKLTLFGWTSPFALVELRGSQVYAETTANIQGYFYFDRVFLPQTANSPELCLSAIDTQDRTSFPTCLPPLPMGLYHIRIGPVLLAPTLSLEKGSFLAGQQVAARGETIPNTEVTIFLANEIKKSLLRGGAPTGDDSSEVGRKNLLVKSAYAFSLPQYQIISDETGHFEFNLPAGRGGVTPPATWRVFASADYLDSPTPKSNTLAFKILFWWQCLWERLIIFLSNLKPYWWAVIILVEIVIIIFLYSSFSSKSNSSKSKLQSPRYENFKVQSPNAKQMSNAQAQMSKKRNF